MLKKLQTCTELLHGGRDPALHGGMVNVPIYRGSTVLSHSLEQWESRKQPDNPYASYGRFGTPTTRALEELVADMEGGYRSLVFPSGLAACTHAIMSVLSSGDHILLPDSVYGPTRAFAQNTLARFNIAAEFYAPDIGAGIGALLRPNTRLVYVEAPGSGTFEMQDIPAIAEQAHKAGAYVAMDNTWATPLYFKPFEHGVDISIQAATKYLIGHSDALLGVATANEHAWPLLRKGAHDFGQTIGPDDIFLALRGIRTLPLRLRQHWDTGVKLAQMLAQHPLVARVMHPALPGDPGHALWKRDFLGASGLFAIETIPMPAPAFARFIDQLRLFGIGLSWGGYESLVLPMDAPKRSASPFEVKGRIVRIHAGLEDSQDLIADLQQALQCASDSLAVSGQAVEAGI
ncbi:cystathionine beta-lyase [Paracandidimonas soli]|uniref:Cystathionine beta-lyase n=2 Tax=Paracandidimonas soli TaxID=1917182 RepID=A0A4R3VFZ0_9BURK|nr:cystathionine beta-lyase [Paracandidimonas soli]TCV02599.1 cystathionine beta-lyase [Paracandidimonas soli]